MSLSDNLFLGFPVSFFNLRSISTMLNDILKAIYGVTQKNMNSILISAFFGFCLYLLAYFLHAIYRKKSIKAEKKQRHSFRPFEIDLERPEINEDTWGLVEEAQTIMNEGEMEPDSQHVILPFESDKESSQVAKLSVINLQSPGNIDSEYAGVKFSDISEQLLRDFGSDIHEDVKIERMWRPGLSGLPVRETGPSVFWKNPLLYYDEKSNNKIDEFIEEIYTLIKNIEDVKLFNHKDMNRALLALINYSIWKRRNDWIYTIVFRLNDLKYNNSKIKLIAAISAAGDRQKLLGNYLLNSWMLSGASEEDRYGILCYRFMSHSSPEEKPNLELIEGEQNNLRLMWLYEAAAGNIINEKALVQKIIASCKSEDEAQDIFFALLTRGKIYTAIRFLYRRVSNVSHRDAALLNLYFINSNYNRYLHKIKKSKMITNPIHWFEIVYSIFRLSGAENLVENVSNFIEDFSVTNMPLKSKRDYFVTGLTENKFDLNELDISKYNHCILYSFHLENQKNLSQNESEKKSFISTLETHLNKIKIEATVDTGNELLLQNALWGSVDQKLNLDTPFRHYLISLSGRTILVRLFLGMHYYHTGNIFAAVKYLKKSPEHPLKNYYLYESMIHKEDISSALYYYKKLKTFYSDESSYWLTFGLLLKRIQRNREALSAVNRSLALNPGNQEALKLSLLLKQKIAS